MSGEDGEYFVAADLSAIEARVIATLAGEESMLQRFRSGDDIYIWLANQIFPGVPVIKDGLNDYLRKLCKEAVLGIGFGMGFETFERKVLRVAPETRHEDIRRVFDSFKSMFPRIAVLRSEMWDAFNQALSVPGAHRAGRCTFTLLDAEAEAGASMLVELPSGRFLHYRSIWTEESTTRWGAPCTDCWYADGFEYSTEQRKGKRGPKSRLCPDNRWRDRVSQTAVIENVVQATARDIFVHQMLDMCHSPGSWGHPSPSTWDQGETRATALLIA